MSISVKMESMSINIFTLAAGVPYIAGNWFLRTGFQLGKRCAFEVDGYKDFVFLNANGLPFTTSLTNAILKRAVSRYNAEEQASAEKNGRVAVLLPHISNHILRHTGCTRMAECGMDVKVLQTIMGHSNIAVTMNVYNHVTEERMRKEMQRLERVM